LCWRKEEKEKEMLRNKQRLWSNVSKTTSREEELDFERIKLLSRKRSIRNSDSRRPRRSFRIRSKRFETNDLFVVVVVVVIEDRAGRRSEQCRWYAFVPLRATGSGNRTLRYVWSGNARGNNRPSSRARRLVAVAAAAAAADAIATRATSRFSDDSFKG